MEAPETPEVPEDITVAPVVPVSVEAAIIDRRWVAGCIIHLWVEECGIGLLTVGDVAVACFR